MDMSDDDYWFQQSYDDAKFAETQDNPEATWESQLAAARKLPDDELRRHASVSTNNRHTCRECFTCAAAAVVLERMEYHEAIRRHEAVEVSKLPWCDIHKGLKNVEIPAAYDGATTLPGSKWANMCEDCFGIYGLGLGLGRGQRLILRETTQPTTKESE